MISLSKNCPNNFKPYAKQITHLFELNQKLTSLVVDETKKRGGK